MNLTDWLAANTVPGEMPAADLAARYCIAGNTITVPGYVRHVVSRLRKLGLLTDDDQTVKLTLKH